MSDMKSLARTWLTVAGREVVSGGKVVFKKDGDLYFLRSVAKSHEGWTADYKPSGHKRATLKIRLGG